MERLDRSGNAMDNPLILVIDDSQTIRKMVECHLSQAGYRVAMAADAEHGLELARTIAPAVDPARPPAARDDRRRGLPEAAGGRGHRQIPVVISSAMRNRAFAQYTEFPNVVDQIPKPFTPELLKSGVANALQTGAMVVQAQRTGCAMPEAVGEVDDAVPGGEDRVVPAPGAARLPEQSPADRQADRGSRQGPGAVRRWPAAGSRRCTRRRSARTGWRTGFRPTSPTSVRCWRSPSASSRMRRWPGWSSCWSEVCPIPGGSGPCSGSRRRALTYLATTGEPGKFAFERVTGLPPMFQAFPLQISVPALVVEGSRYCDPAASIPGEWERLDLRSPDRPAAGTPIAPAWLPPRSRSTRCWTVPAAWARWPSSPGSDLAEVVAIAAGPGAGRAGRAPGPDLLRLHPRRGRRPGDRPADPPHARRRRGRNYQLKIVHDRIAAQLLLRRQTFHLVILAMDRPEQEAFFRACKQQHANGTRYVGILNIEEESELARLDAIGLDGVMHRPVSESDLVATVNHLLPK